MKAKVKIAIEREYAFNDLLRDYQVLVDGKSIGRLEPEGEIEFEADTDGVIKLKIDWCYSNEIKIIDYNDPVQLYLKAKSNIYGWKRLAILYYVFFRRNKYIKLSVSKVE